jgi:hypothetical protein
MKIAERPALRTRLPKYMQHERTRHGKSVYYVRRGSGKRIRIHAEFGTPEFHEAYQAALHGAEYRAKPSPARDTPDVRKRQRIGRQLQKALSGARQRAAASGRGIDVDLDWAIAKVMENDCRCVLTGIPFFAHEAKGLSRNPYAPSLDRIDCRLGYTKENTRIVLYAVNVMLLDWGIDVFERVANAYRSNKGRT